MALGVFMTEDEWHEAPTAMFRLRDDGIVEIRCKDRAEDTVETVKVLLERLEQLLDGRGPVPVLAILGERLGLTAEARAYIAHYEKMPFIASRSALVVEAPVARVVGNVYVGLRHEGNPIKLFGTAEAALPWLKEGAS